MVFEGPVICIVGEVLSMVTAVDRLLADEELPALSEAEPAGTVNAKVPSPLILLNVTV